MIEFTALIYRVAILRKAGICLGLVELGGPPRCHAAALRLRARERERERACSPISRPTVSIVSHVGKHPYLCSWSNGHANANTSEGEL